MRNPGRYSENKPRDENSRLRRAARLRPESTLRQISTIRYDRSADRLKDSARSIWGVSRLVKTSLESSHPDLSAKTATPAWAYRNRERPDERSRLAKFSVDQVRPGPVVLRRDDEELLLPAQEGVDLERGRKEPPTGGPRVGGVLPSCRRAAACAGRRSARSMPRALVCVTPRRSSARAPGSQSSRAVGRPACTRGRC